MEPLESVARLRYGSKHRKFYYAPEDVQGLNEQLTAASFPIAAILRSVASCSKRGMTISESCAKYGTLIDGFAQRIISPYQSCCKVQSEFSCLQIKISTGSSRFSWIGFAMEFVFHVRLFHHSVLIITRLHFFPFVVRALQPAHRGLWQPLRG